MPEPHCQSAGRPVAKTATVPTNMKRTDDKKQLANIWTSIGLGVSVPNPSLTYAKFGCMINVILDDKAAVRYTKSKIFENL
jgi:hypothetical protein